MSDNEKINMEDLPESQREIAEQIGIEGYRKLMNYTGGCSIYVAQVSRITKRKRNEMIRADYNAGIPLRAIAIKYNLSVSRIWQIINNV